PLTLGPSSEVELPALKTRTIIEYFGTQGDTSTIRRETRARHHRQAKTPESAHHASGAPTARGRHRRDGRCSSARVRGCEVRAGHEQGWARGGWQPDVPDDRFRGL